MILATMLRAVRAIHSSVLVHQGRSEGPISRHLGTSRHRPSKILPRIRETTKEPRAAWAALRQIESRLILIESGTDSDVKVRSKNPSIACRIFIRSREGRRNWTLFE